MMNPGWRSKGDIIALVIAEMSIESHYSVRDECQRWGTMEAVYVSGKTRSRRCQNTDGGTALWVGKVNSRS